VPAAWSLDHVGIFSRTVADATLALSVLAAYDPGDPGSAVRPAPDLAAVLGPAPPAPPRLGLVRDPFLDRAQPAVREHLESVARRLAEQGAVVEPVVLPPILPALVAATMVVVRTEAAAYHADLHREHAAEYRPRIRAAIEVGLCVPAPLYLRAQRLRRQARRELAPLLARFDALVMPPAPAPAPDRATTGDASFNAPWSGIGTAQIALPTGSDAGGFPLGVQLIGAPFAEARLLAAARWVEGIVGPGAEPPDPT
jgi:aspartyl-tRNA(Asn)/glutamyl-tRNA(Gln) amidotransferase subunit A